MKYIIDIPNADVSRWVGETPLGKKLYVPISIDDGNEYYISTGIYAEKYTEPDRKAIEDEVWKFYQTISNMKIYEQESAFGTSSWWSVINKHSYQEAKSKYEAWLKQKDEIRVGDEVEQNTANGSFPGRKCVVVKIDGDKMQGIGKDGSIVLCSSQVKRWWRKTGRHFDSVEKLLEEMRKSDG